MNIIDNKSECINDIPISIDDLSKNIKANLMLLSDHIHIDSSMTILNIGCGLGYESLAMNKVSNCNVIGIDNKCDESLAKNADIKLINGDILSLEISKKFEIIYCYHVLEHVDDPHAVLIKVKQLLTENGVAFFGFPNKQRILGYLNPSPTQKVSLLTKILWNINDYKYRISGKFENKYGAHAGFSQKEFKDMASIHFNVHNVSKNYYDSKYAANKLYKIINNVGLMNYIQPSLYYILKLKD